MTILVVDDDEAIRTAAAAALEDVGYRVTSSATAEAALAAAGGGRPPEVAVVDLALGSGMGGIELGQELLARFPGIGVLYATGNPAEFDGRIIGPRERYVLKPFSEEALVGAVRRLRSSLR